MTLGDRELPFGDASLLHLVQLGGDEAQHLLHILGSRADRDGEGPGVVVRDAVGTYRVRQAPLLTHLLEEAAREAAAESVIEHSQVEALLRTSLGGSEAENKMSLLAV